MAISQTNDEIEKFLSLSKYQIEKEKKNLGEGEKKLSNLLNAFSQKAPSNSVINTLFKDEPEGFVFSKYEDKRKQLANQRRAEYNAYLEKKEAERLSKNRINQERRNASAKSILDSVDYDRVLAKRKEEEAKFRSMNIADVIHSSRPALRENRETVVPAPKSIEQPRAPVSMNMHPITLPGSIMSTPEKMSQYSLRENRIDLEALEKQNAQILEDRIAKVLEEQRHTMLLEFENEIRKNNLMKEEIQNLKANSERMMKEEIQNLKANSERIDLPKRIQTPVEEIPKMGRTGGGGEPVKDSYGNLITMRGWKKENISDYGSVLSLPGMQQQPAKDRMALYREELKKQIEEKKRLEASEKAKALELEERLAKRMEEQRLKELEEYEKELKKNDRMKLEFQRQQDRIKQLEEFQRRDAEERLKRMAEAKPPPSETRLPEPVVERSNSPPIPAVRTKVLLERAVSPVKLLTEVKPDNTISSLAAIRKKIKEEQEKLKKDQKNSYEVMNRRTVQEASSDDEDDLLKTSYQSIF